VLGVVAVPMCMLAVPSILAIVFGLIGLRHTAGGRREGRGLAIAGLVLGIVTLAAAVLFWTLLLASGDCVSENGEFHCDWGNE
jgi:hypothetical protein